MSNSDQLLDHSSSTPEKEVGATEFHMAVSDDGLKPSPIEKASDILEKLELLSFKKGKSTDINFSELTDSQKDRVIDVMVQNEDNMVKYHMRRLDMLEKVSLKKIDATTASQRTNRIYFIVGTIALLATTLVILLLKESFFVPWLTFLTGLAGGFGVAKLNQKTEKATKGNDKIEEEDE
ncbi:hypothetical protein ACDQ55_07780 [Chitinophaga sp. 30R24]|uniref:hypothetical protein n=1 Tax=Chitinophaga sp. 30R24 TaxID=3248838 RepID=UPI003B8F7F5C